MKRNTEDKKNKAKSKKEESLKKMNGAIVQGSAERNNEERFRQKDV